MVKLQIQETVKPTGRERDHDLIYYAQEGFMVSFMIIYASDVNFMGCTFKNLS